MTKQLIILEKNENLVSEYDFKFNTELGLIKRIAEAIKNGKSPENTKDWAEMVYNSAKEMIEYNKKFNLKAKI